MHHRIPGMQLDHKVGFHIMNSTWAEAETLREGAGEMSFSR